MKSILTYVCLTAVITAIPTSNIVVRSDATLDLETVSYLPIGAHSPSLPNLDKRRAALDPLPGRPLHLHHGPAVSRNPSLGGQKPSLGRASSTDQRIPSDQKSPAGQAQSLNHKVPMSDVSGFNGNPSLDHGSPVQPKKASTRKSTKSSSTARLQTSSKSLTYIRSTTSAKIVSSASVLISTRSPTTTKTPSMTPAVKTSSIKSTKGITPSLSSKTTVLSTSTKSSTGVTRTMSNSKLTITTQSRIIATPTKLTESNSVGSYSSMSTWSSAALSSSKRPTSTSSSEKAIKTCAGNTAADRSNWCDFNIDTDWNVEAPNTGVEREYWLEITNITTSPDGHERVALAINGTIPGPTIEANWGDTVKIHVTNSLENNGTTIHWHGLRQNYTVQQDGVPSIIQCPDAPGTTHTYSWRATQYGTSWYHSHYALQAWEGVFGPLVIHGPATANYDIDLGPVMINDWSHKTVDALYEYAQTRGPPTMDTALINGKGTFNGSGDRHEMSFQLGKKHRLRFINSAIDTYFKLSLDGHNMTVIAMDFVPVVPFSVKVLDIAMGQRYDVVIEADQTATDYWFRSIPQSSCSENDNTNDIRAIVRYDNSSTSDPTTTAWNQTDACVDVSYSLLVPHVPHTIVDPTQQNTTLAVSLGQDSDHYKWTIGMDNMKVIWNNPSLLQIVEGNATWESAENAYLLPDANQWVYWAIDTVMPIPHPIHIHGHDFYILAQEAGATYNASTVSLNLSNPPRRDVANLPAAGYLVIAFYTDNPGTWLMHCHIGWHVAEGLALQFVERQSEIAALVNATEIESTCAAWNTFNNNTLTIEQDDSGV